MFAVCRRIETLYTKCSKMYKKFDRRSKCIGFYQACKHGLILCICTFQAKFGNNYSILVYKKLIAEEI